jgi:hypothetical protein
MNTHELTSALAVASEDVSMAIVYALCGILMVGTLVMVVVVVWVDIRDWRRTATRESTPAQQGGFETARGRNRERPPVRRTASRRERSGS